MGLVRKEQIMAKRWMTARLLAAGLGVIAAAAIITSCAANAAPAGKHVEAVKTDQAQAKFRDTFRADKAALANRGSNTYMVLEPGYKLILADGKDTLTITVLDETKTVDGVKTRILEERETKGGKLEEVSRNYFAFDKATGDIYYFGEDVDMYDTSGQVKSHEGSWLSGVDGAKFGLMMPGKPRVGDRYQQEIAPGVAMDRAEIISLAETVKVPAGTFKNCLKTKESSALEKGVETKVHAPRVGLLRDGGFELAKIEKPASSVTLPDPVMKTFKNTFPKAEISKLDMDEENGVTVYDIEFTDGATEKETDIAADGTMLEFTVVIGTKDTPAAVMQAVQKAAKGAEIKRIEQIQISHETRDGKVIKWTKPAMHYAVELAKGTRRTEIVLDPNGTVVEPAKWGPAKEE
jgi:hypothetical protein